MPAAKTRSPLSHGSSAIDWHQAHETLRGDDHLWCFLRFEGLQPDGTGGLFEARTCPRCQSTILRAVSQERALTLCEQLHQILALALKALTLSARCHRQPEQSSNKETALP